LSTASSAFFGLADAWACFDFAFDSILRRAAAEFGAFLFFLVDGGNVCSLSVGCLCIMPTGLLDDVGTSDC